MECEAKFVTEPIVYCIAGMQLYEPKVLKMMEWVKSRAPACVPDALASHGMQALFPHDMCREDGSALSDNELLVELAGRKCYNSFGEKAGRKSNKEYIEHTQAGDVAHASILYHAKQSFFIAGVSRRVSHELIRNYVGADRDEEGSPSQESTRFVENAGYYIIPPRLLENEEDAEFDSLSHFMNAMQQNYSDYMQFVRGEQANYRRKHGNPPKGIDYKRILEAASAILSHTVETSWIWTTNPMATAKLMRERNHSAADLEFWRFARTWLPEARQLNPNLYPQPWMQEGGGR